jgi:hypothetical protein
MHTRKKQSVLPFDSYSSSIYGNFSSEHFSGLSQNKQLVLLVNFNSTRLFMPLESILLSRLGGEKMAKYLQLHLYQEPVEVLYH